MAPFAQTLRDYTLRPQQLLRLIAAAVSLVGAHLGRYWALWLGVAGVFLAAVAGLDTGIQRLLFRWNDPYSYGHSYLVLPLAAWLFVAGLRGQVLGRVGPSVAGVMALVAVVAFYGLSEVMDFTLGMQVALPAIVLAGILALAGFQLARHAVIPVGMLYFTVPVWDHIVGFLQDAATAVVTTWLRWTGITAHIDGYLITIRSGVLEIADACSGLRFVLVSLILSSFFAFYWLRRWRFRLLLLAAALFAAILGNWVRIYALVLIGDWSSMQHYLIAESHYAFGWVVFYLFMAPVLWFGLWLESREPRAPARAGAPRVERVASPAAFLVVAILASATVASPALLRGGEVPAEPQQVHLLPDAPEAWEKVDASGDWQPEFVLPHMVGRDAFVSQTGDQVEVFLARYLRQQPGSKLIATMNTLAPGWRVMTTSTLNVVIGDETRRVQSSEIASRTGRRLLLSWYVVGGRTTHDEKLAKLLEIPALLIGRRDGAVIAVSSSCGVTCDGAEEALSGFLESSGFALEAVAAGDIDPNFID